MIILILVTTILSEVSERFKRINSLECKFTEVMSLDGDTLKFSGSVYIRIDAARIDVERPDSQVIVIRGDSIYIYIRKDRRLERSIAPLSLSRLLYSPCEYYRVDSVKNEWIYLSPRDKITMLPLCVRFNKRYLPTEIKFFQEGGEGIFKFYDYLENVNFPECFFSIDSLG